MKSGSTYSVLFLASWYPTRIKPTHGIFIQRHAEAIALYNKVNVVYAAADALSNNEEYQLVENTSGKLRTVIVYYKKVNAKLPLIKNVIRLNRVFKAYKKGIQHISNQQGKQDILHLNVVLPVGLIALWISRKLKLKYIVSEHWSGYLPEDGNYKGFFNKLITQKVISAAQLVTVVSQRMQQSMIAHRLQNKFERINYVINTDIFYPKKNSPSGNKLKLIHVSSLVNREKNITGILSVMKRLKENGIDFQLNIVGTGREINEYINYVKINELHKHVIFVGHKLPAEVAEYIREAHAFILFSYFEGMPNVLLESLSCGTPVISSKVGAVPEHIDHKLGILVDVANEDQLYDAILNIKDSVLNYSIEEMNSFIQKNFSAASVGKRFTTLYGKALAIR